MNVPPSHLNDALFCCVPVPLLPVQFAVQYDARAAPKLDRMAVIDTFASIVPVSPLAALAALGSSAPRKAGWLADCWTDTHVVVCHHIAG